MKALLEEANQFYNEIVEWRRYFHKNAETHINLPKTTAYVMKELSKMGYEPKEICQCGVLATAGERNLVRPFC